MPNSSLNISGNKGLLAALERLGDTKTQRKLVSPVLRKIMKGKVLPQIQSAAPVDSGELKANLKVKLRNRKGAFAAYATAPFAYAFVLHYGVVAGTEAAAKIGARDPDNYMIEYLNSRKEQLIQEAQDQVFDEIEKEFLKGGAL